MSVLCVTQKSVVSDDFLARIEKILSAKPYALVLREKEMEESEYRQLAYEIYSLCKKYQTELFLNADIMYTVEIAKQLSCGIHTSFANYENFVAVNKKMQIIKDCDIKFGLSIHSDEEAQFIIKNYSSMPISHIIAGHIFETDCKKDLPPRGLDFLKSIVDNIPCDIPVFGIGGMTPMRTPAVLATGAKGVAVMSSLMKCDDPIQLMNEFNISE